MKLTATKILHSLTLRKSGGTVDGSSPKGRVEKKIHKQSTIFGKKAERHGEREEFTGQISENFGNKRRRVLSMRSPSFISNR